MVKGKEICLEAYKQYPEYKGMSLLSCLNTMMFDRELEVVRNKYVLRSYQFPSIIHEIATTSRRDCMFNDPD